MLVPWGTTAHPAAPTNIPLYYQGLSLSLDQFWANSAFPCRPKRSEGIVHLGGRATVNAFWRISPTTLRTASITAWG
jgi:hypothetical protein